MLALACKGKNDVEEEEDEEEEEEEEGGDIKPPLVEDTPLG